MKKNLSLFLILIGLLFATYLFQEKRVEQNIEDKKASAQVVKSQITALSFGDVNAKKINGQWWSQDGILLSHNSMNIVEKKLREIMIVKEVSGEWASYFPNPFSFSVNGLEYTLGDLTLDRQGFYLSENKKIMLVEIEGESYELTQDETEVAKLKLDQLKRELGKNLSELKENQFFRFYPGVPFERVTIASDGNLPFEINFKSNTTLPPPIPGIKEHAELQKKFFSILTQMTIKMEIPYEEKNKFKKLSTMTFLSQDKKVTWELWMKSKDSADAIVIDPDLKKSYQMVGGTLKVFFIHLQDYWDKKVIPPSEFKNFSSLKMTFIQGAKKAEVEVLNKEPLDFNVKGYKVKPERMQELMYIIFNLSATDQAERVSLLSKSEKKQVLSEDHLRIELMGQDLLLWEKGSELIVVNLTQGFKAHFSLLEKSLSFKFQDVLE